MTSGITSSYETIQAFTAPDPDPDPPKPSDESLLEEKPVPRPSSTFKNDNDSECNQSNLVTSTDKTSSEPCSLAQEPESPKAGPIESTYVLATEPTVSPTFKKNEVKRSISLPRPPRPPPPVGYYGGFSSTPKSTSMPSVTEDGQESTDSSVSSSQQSPLSPAPSDEQNLFGVYRPMTEDSAKPAVPPRPPQPKQPYVSSILLRETSSQLQGRPPPPAFSPPPPPSENEPLYSEIQFPAYLHILPEHGDEKSHKKSTIISRSSTHRSSMACTQEIMEMLRWLKIVSKADFMAPSLYGASIEEEIRSFHETAMNLKKALRLFNLLMMKRGEVMRDHISELIFISNAMDKALKKKKTIQVAGGTTGAVGGVTAVVGLALAPVTLGASLIATVVGAGLVASAGGVSAHAAKAKKKVITRDGVERLINDYTDKVKDVEHCLSFILSAMNELRRYDIARLQRAGAQPDALKIAHLTQSVLNNMDYLRRNPTAQTVGMSSERLLYGFAKEMDYYFTEKEGQKIKRSRKSKFSGRVRLLGENLQDELDYLNHMWELFS